MADQTVTIRLRAEIAAFKSAMSQASTNARSAASGVRAAWSNSSDTATTAAGRVEKAWAGTGQGGIIQAANMKRSWAGVEVPGVTGAKLVSSAWSVSGDRGKDQANGVAGAWQKAGTTAGAAATKVAPWAQAGDAGKRSAHGLGDAYMEAGTKAAGSATKAAPWAHAGEAGKASANGLGDAYTQAGGKAAESATKVAPWAHAGDEGKNSARALGDEYQQTGRKAAASASDATVAMKKTSESADELARKQHEYEQSWRDVSTAATIAGTGILAGVGYVVKAYADFDQAMSTVKADTHESAENMDKLREAAVKAGEDTAYSATEAAGAIDELAKAGVSTSDILGGGLHGALDLAAAGELEVQEAAEIAASAMTQFGLKGNDLNHVADLLAAGAGKAQGSVHDMGKALNQAGLIASQAGLSIEETTGGLAAFAAAGLTGSDAGTSFKTMLQRLQAPSKESQLLLDQLGITMYDQEGKFVGLANLSGQLHDKMSGMTDAQRNAALATIFGSDAVRGANVLYTQGQEGIQGWIDKVNDAGYASETASAKQDNLRGDLEKLGGSIESVFLKSGSGANEMLRNIVQFAEKVVDWIGRIPGPVLTAVAGFTALLGATALLVGGGMKLISMLSALNRAFTALSGINAGGKLRDFASAAGSAATKSGLLGTALKGLTIAGAVLGAFVELSNKLAPTALGFDKVSSSMDTTGKSIDKLDAAFKNADWSNTDGKDSMFAGTIEGINGVGDAVAKLGNADGFDKFAMKTSKFVGMKDSYNTMAEDISHVDKALADMVANNNFEGASANFRKIAEDAKKSGVSMQEIVPQFSQYEKAVREYADSLHVSLSDQEVWSAMMGEIPPKLADAAGGAEKAKDGLEDMGDTAKETAHSLEDIVKNLTELGLAHISEIEAQSKFQESLADVSGTIEKINKDLGGMGQVLNETGDGFDLTTAAGREAQDAYTKVAKAGIEYANTLAKSHRPQAEIVGQLQDTYDGLMRTAGQFGLTGEAADKLARDVMGIPDGKSIETWMDDYANEKAQEIKGNIEAIPDEKWVQISASDQGTVSAIQDKIDTLHGTAPKVLITDQGTVQLTQDQIDGIYGKTTDIAVTDQGTVLKTQGKIDGITDGDAMIWVDQQGVAHVQTDIDHVHGKTVYVEAKANGIHDVQARIDGIRGKTVQITVQETWSKGRKVYVGKKGAGHMYTGGLVSDAVRGFAAGGIPGAVGYGGGGLLPGVPPRDPYMDNLPARVMGSSTPIMLRSREYVVNERQTRRNLKWIEWINAGGVLPGSPSDLTGRRGFSGGGPTGPVSATHRGFRPSKDGPEIIGAAVSSALSSYRPVVHIGGRDFYGVMKTVERQYGARR
ncbi:phage tail tape measure protein [Rothia koreensis]|uniref:phage tail tape measure protein n=1 Tax=Rothia koreensis TaxID=592378 RepID=UPI0037C61595